MKCISGNYCAEHPSILCKMGFTKLGKEECRNPTQCVCVSHSPALSVLVLKLRLLDDPGSFSLTIQLAFWIYKRWDFGKENEKKMSHSQRFITSNLKLVFGSSDLFISLFVQFHSSLWKFPRYNSLLCSIQSLLRSITILCFSSGVLLLRLGMTLSNIYYFHFLIEVTSFFFHYVFLNCFIYFFACCIFMVFFFFTMVLIFLCETSSHS